MKAEFIWTGGGVKQSLGQVANWVARAVWEMEANQNRRRVGSNGKTTRQQGTRCETLLDETGHHA